MAEEGAALVEAWTSGLDGGDAAVDELSDRGSAAVDELVNDAVFLLEAMSDRELGRAIGDMEGGPDPTAIVEGPGGLGVVDLRGRLDGLRAVLVGDGDGAGGLAPLLGDDLVGRLDAELAAASAAVDDMAALGVPLREAVERHPGTVRAAVDALDLLQVTVATEVVSELGVAVGFSDADGDSG
jgi:predicted lipoprotein